MSKDTGVAGLSSSAGLEPADSRSHSTPSAEVGKGEGKNEGFPGNFGIASGVALPFLPMPKGI